MTALTANRARALLTYEPITGEFAWRNRTRLKTGYINGKGYLSIMIDGRNWPAHRLAWLMVHGTLPAGHIDHINGNRADNRIENLRDVAPAENQRNMRMDRRNKSGVSGVRWRDDRAAWEAQIRVDNKPKFLGRFKDLEAAMRARKEAERRFGFHPNHGRAA